MRSAILRRLSLYLCVVLTVGVAAGCGATAAQASHPRILLNKSILSDLRSRAKQGTAQWKALQKVCDTYKVGKVNRPDGNGYPDNGGIGSGYQGDGYFPIVFALGLCYQSTTGVDNARHKRYGKIGAQLISKMATTGKHAAVPTTDDGYGIRNYGTGLAVGDDWFNPVLKSGVRKRVRAVLKHWISSYQKKGFGHEFPQGNYYAGYYDTVAMTALGVDKGPISWSKFLSKVQTPVAKYYQANLTGGGWPEGWNYGPLATFNMSLPVLAAQTARGVDLTSGYHFPLGAGQYLVNFTWPDRTTLDDSDAIHSGDNPTAAESWLDLFQAGVLEEANDAFAPYLRSYARALRSISDDAALGEPWTAWINFYFDRGQPEKDFTQLPLSYFAKGIDRAAMRSSWDTSAVWGAFKGGPYINNPDNGEEFSDKGSLAIVNGKIPFLVNAPAALERNTPGTDDGSDLEDSVYGELFGDGTDDRNLFNVFYTDSPTPTGQGEGLRSTGAKTNMAAFDDAGGSAYMRSEHLEDQYPRAGDKTINLWTREVTYVRPGTFVVHDRTSVTDAGIDQWMGFHLSGEPVAADGAGDGVKSYDVTAKAGYAGRVDTVLPAGRTETVTNVFDSGKDYRLEIHGAKATDQEWLTVFDASPDAGSAAKATALTKVGGSVLSGGVSGVSLAFPTGNEAVLFSQGAAPITDTVEYKVPAAPTIHVVSGFAPKASVTVTASGGDIKITQGGSMQASDAGVLRFTTNASGALG